MATIFVPRIAVSNAFTRRALFSIVIREVDTPSPSRADRAPVRARAILVLIPVCWVSRTRSHDGVTNPSGKYQETKRRKGRKRVKQDQMMK